MAPSELLAIFLDSEARTFASRFEQAAEATLSVVGGLEQSISQRIREMGEQLGWADYKVDETGDSIESVLAIVARLKAEADETRARLKSIIQQQGLRDPIKEKAEAEMLSQVVDYLNKNPALADKLEQGGTLRADVSGLSRDLSEDDVRRILSEAVGKYRQASASSERVNDSPDDKNRD